MRIKYNIFLQYLICSLFYRYLWTSLVFVVLFNAAETVNILKHLLVTGTISSGSSNE